MVSKDPLPEDFTVRADWNRAANEAFDNGVIDSTDWERKIADAEDTEASTVNPRILRNGSKEVFAYRVKSINGGYQTDTITYLLVAERNSENGSWEVLDQETSEPYDGDFLYIDEVLDEDELTEIGEEYLK